MSSDSTIARLQQLLDEQDDSKFASAVIEIASDRLQRLTRKMLRNYPRLRRWEETDDVFQNALMRLHRALTDVRVDSVGGLFKLAATQIRRTLIDLSRHHFGPEGAAGHHESDINLARDTDAGTPKIDNVPATGEPESVEEWTAFHLAVERLPAKERVAFELVWYTGLSQAEAAEVLGVSVPTIQRWWYRARHLLSESLR